MKTISTKRADKIARNINAMDVNFEYSDDIKVYKFWRNLKNKLEAILEGLSDADKQIIVALCDEVKAKYFKLEKLIKTFRSEVFKKAYEIMKTTNKAFAVCLGKAWELYRLTKQMKTV